MEKQFFHRRSAILDRLDALPADVALDIIDDVAEALKTRIHTMETILAARRRKT